MCGITGFLDRRSESSTEVLDRMSCSIPHRGPDGEGSFFHQGEGWQVGLGHRRLSIIDLSDAANQPMHYAGYHLIFNGEIYNYNEIRKELLSLGHQFVTHSDTEVILHSWQQWGENSIRKLRGMFAIALFDSNSNQLILIRDRPGVKPLYYYQADGLFLFGSELKSLLAHPGFKREIDPDAVAAFLQYGNVPQPHCIFRNAKKLPAGHLMRISLDSNRNEIKQYWNVYDYYNRPKLRIGFQEAVEETERILIDSFKYRMVSDVPVGVFLSGGYDSSCVTALLQKNYPETIRTFTIGTTDKKLDEAPFATTIANYLGTDHTEYYCTPKEALDIIPELPYYYDEPFADSSAIPTILVSRLARKDVTVALSADGGDELFAGYNRYDYIRKLENMKSVPRPVRKMAAMAMNSVAPSQIPFMRNRKRFSSRYEKLLSLLRNPSMQELMLNLSQAFSFTQVQQLMKPAVKELSNAIYSKELKEEYYDPLSYMMAIDFQTYLVDDILHKVDRATMSVSLEGREPFLDQNIVEWAAQLPSSFKLHNGEKKYILKQIVYRHIPKEMMERPKMGFGIPLAEWLMNELKPLVIGHLADGNFGHDFFNKEEVTRLLQRFFSGHPEEHQKIWNLLMFQLWFCKHGKA